MENPHEGDLNCPKDKGKDNPVCGICFGMRECERNAHLGGECWDDCSFCAGDKRFHDGGTCALLGVECKYCNALANNKIWCSSCFEEYENLVAGVCDECHRTAHEDRKCLTGCPYCQGKINKADCQ